MGVACKLIAMKSITVGVAIVPLVIKNVKKLIFPMRADAFQYWLLYDFDREWAKIVRRSTNIVCHSTNTSGYI